VRQFEGAVIAVSHDRYFLKRIATRVLLVSLMARTVLSHGLQGSGELYDT